MVGQGALTVGGFVLLVFTIINLISPIPVSIALKPVLLAG